MATEGGAISGNNDARNLRATREEAAIVRMLVARVRRGDSLAEISRTTRISKSILSRLARQAGLRYPKQRPTTAQVSQVVADVVQEGMTLREAAEHRGLSKSAVHRYVQTQRERAVNRAGRYRFAQQRQARNCPIHGRVTVWPCVACTAEAATSEIRLPHQ